MCKKKIERCNYAHMHFSGDYSCIQEGLQNLNKRYSYV